MQLTKFFAVFVALFGRICPSKIIIDTNNLDEFAELETAALRILKNCYGNKDKTMVLIGDFPGNFIKKLSAYQNSSIILVDPRRRAEHNICHWEQEKPQPTHKVHILVMIVPFYRRFGESIQAYMDCRYYTNMPFVLVLGWSPKRKNACCDERSRTFEILFNANHNNLLHTNLICQHRTKGIVIYGYNAFINYAPKPWQLVLSRKAFKSKNMFSYFAREYRDNDGMCENIFFDKTRDLNGWPIKISITCGKTACRGKLKKSSFKDRRIHIQSETHMTYIRDFITYINGTQVPVWRNIIIGKAQANCYNCLSTSPIHMRGVVWYSSFTYPYKVECKYLVTQFRGNKSQLKKIYDVIDGYSWVGILIVYFITLIFFKCLLHQTLIEGLLNICRLTCNFGLTTSPRNLASRIYFGCLLFFLVTMLGILTGNLASLLTHDIPVRQINSIGDVIDQNYTVYASVSDFRQIKDAGFKGRLIKLLLGDKCLQYVKRDPLVACLTWGAPDKTEAEHSKLHASSGCVHNEYLVNLISFKWPFEEKINKFILTKIGSGIMTDLDVMVDEKRLLEAESEEAVLDPEIMSWADLGFAFAIFGVGLGCSVISFMVEIMIYRFQRRVTTTRVIVLN